MAQTEIETRISPTGRVEALTAGVIAIAITLLVLDLQFPRREDVRDGGLVAALLSRWHA